MIRKKRPYVWRLDTINKIHAPFLLQERPCWPYDVTFKRFGNTREVWRSIPTMRKSGRTQEKLLFGQNDTILLRQLTEGLTSFIPARLIFTTVLRIQCYIRMNT